MSGFEIVGIVLGGLPLIISVAKDYKEGFEPILQWHHFRREFRVFINNVDLENQMFDCLVGRLLEYTDLSSQEKDNLLLEADPDRWCQPDIENSLKRRLGDSCAVCLQQLEAIRDDFVKLQSIMSLKDGSVDWAKEGKDKWKYQRKRISHSFRGKGPATVAALGEKNRKFRDLLDELDKKATRQDNQQKAVSKDTTWAKIFECIRRQAISLHLALKKGWNCNCETPHLAALQLKQRATETWSSQFIIAFGSRSGAPNSLDPRRKILITGEQAIVAGSSISGRPQPTPVQERYLNTLRVDFAIAPASKINKQRDRFSMNTHSISAPLPASVNTPPSVARKQKAGKRIAFASSTEIMIEKPSQSLSDTSRGGQRLDDNDAKLGQRHGIDSNTSVTLPRYSDTEFAPPFDPKASRGDNRETIIEIEDLCSTLEMLQPKVSCLGYLSDDEHRQYQLRSLKDSTPQPNKHDLISLDTLLNVATRPRLNRKQRFRLTTILSSSLLQFQTTPWLPDKLDKKEIYFEYDGETVFADQPYIYHFFPSTKSSTPSLDIGTKQPTIGFAARISLTNLGILLLELCFGLAIESTTHWNNILELNGGRQHKQTSFETALEWKAEVEEEAGLDFKNAIDRCFNLDVKPNWTDMKFTQSIYAGVVQPLEKVTEELGWAVVPS